MTATPSLPEPGERFAGYEIRAELGRGAMGAVYRADQDTPRRQVALKVLLPTQPGDQDGRERFDREIDALVAADSPHIVAIYDHGEDRGFRYLAMQLVTEGDLASLLKAGPLPPAEAIELARQVCLGLADAHAAGVLHRDVKPSNVLVRSRPSGRHAYLCDFGIASRSASSAGDATDALTEEGEVVGTWAYLPPERCRGGAATPQGDVYAAGCLLWTMLTGAAPYGTDSVAAALGHLNGTIPQLPSTGPLAVGLNEVWRIALAKDPADRYAGAAEMATALAALPAAAGGGIDAPTVRQAVPPEEPRRRTGRWIAGVTAAALAVALVASLPRLRELLAQEPSTPQESAATCWDDSRAPTLAGCPDPTGMAAIPWVYPTLRTFMASADWECETPVTTVGGKIGSHLCITTYRGDEVEVRFSAWESADSARAHYERTYGVPGSTISLLPGGKQLSWRSDVPGGRGLFSANLAYVSAPFSLSVASADRRALLWAYNRVELRDPADLRGTVE